MSPPARGTSGASPKAARSPRPGKAKASKPSSGSPKAKSAKKSSPRQPKVDAHDVGIAAETREKQIMQEMAMQRLSAPKNSVAGKVGQSRGNVKLRGSGTVSSSSPRLPAGPIPLGAMTWSEQQFLKNRRRASTLGSAPDLSYETPAAKAKARSRAATEAVDNLEKVLGEAGAKERELRKPVVRKFSAFIPSRRGSDIQSFLSDSDLATMSIGTDGDRRPSPIRQELEPPKMNRSASEPPLPDALTHLGIVRGTGTPRSPEHMGREVPPPAIAAWEKELSKRASLSTWMGQARGGPQGEPPPEVAAGLSKGGNKRVPYDSSLVSNVVFGDKDAWSHEVRRRTRPGSVDPGLTKKAVQALESRTRPGASGPEPEDFSDAESVYSVASSLASRARSEGYAGLPAGYVTGEGRRYMTQKWRNGEYQPAGRSDNASVVADTDHLVENGQGESPPSRPGSSRRPVPGMRGFDSKLMESTLRRGGGSRADEVQSEPDPEATQLWSESAGRPSWQPVPNRQKRVVQQEHLTGMIGGFAGLNSHAASEPGTPRSSEVQQLQIPALSKKLSRPLGTTKQLYNFDQDPASPSMQHRGRFDSEAESVGRTVFKDGAGVPSWKKDAPRNKRPLHLYERYKSKDSARAIGYLEAENKGSEPLNQIFEGAAGNRTWIEREKPQGLSSAKFSWNKNTMADVAIHYGHDVDFSGQERVFVKDGSAGMATWEQDESKTMMLEHGRRSLKKQYPAAPVRKACVDTLVFNKTDELDESGGYMAVRGETPRHVELEKYYSLFGDRAGERTWYRSLEDHGQTRGVKLVKDHFHAHASNASHVEGMATPRGGLQKVDPPPRVTYEEGGGAPWDRDFSEKPWLHMRRGQAAETVTFLSAGMHRKERDENIGRRKAKAKELSKGRAAGIETNEIAAQYTRDRRLADGGPLMLA